MTTEQPKHAVADMPGEPLSVPIPPGLARIFGYFGTARYVGFSWKASLHSLSIYDGSIWITGNASPFLIYRQHWAVCPHLSGWSFGNSEEATDDALVLDRLHSCASATPLEIAVAFLKNQASFVSATDGSSHDLVDGQEQSLTLFARNLGNMLVFLDRSHTK